MKISLQSFRQFFMEPPNSEGELFENVIGCMTIIDPDWIQRCKPAPKEDIECLEKTLMERFGQGIPPSYRRYLEFMGEEDGGLVSRQVDDLEFWDYFKRDNMAQGAVSSIKHIEEYCIQFERNTQEPCPMQPFWNFYYTDFAGCGWGFSPKTKCPDQMIESDGIDEFFLTQDTFSQFLSYCTYQAIINQLWDDSTEPDYPIYLFPEAKGAHCVWISVGCPKEWSDPNSDLMARFLEEIEEACCIEECWFSSQKELHLFDPDDAVTECLYEFARYVGCQPFCELTVSMCFERNCEDTTIGIRIVSEDGGCTKWLLEEILKRTTPKKNTFAIRCIR